MNAAETIRPLPGTRERRGAAREARALTDRILTHLCRQRAEWQDTFYRTGRGAMEVRDLSVAIHIVGHMGRGEAPCLGCAEYLGERVLRAMHEGATHGTTQVSVR